MLRSLFAGVSGLRAHQTMMDVVGDNIANVNTAGFKASRVLFQDTLAQTVRGASLATGNLGGINPMQIGLGVRIASVDMTDTQGATQTTGRPTDVAIQGRGYFATRNGAEIVYTRAGGFGVDATGNMVDPTGYIVQGWLSPPGGGPVDQTGGPRDIVLPLAGGVDPRATAVVTVAGNLSADAPVGTVRSTTSTAVDSLGSPRSVRLDMTKSGPGTWNVTASVDGGAFAPIGTLTFDANGKLAPGTALTVAIPSANGSTPSSVAMTFGDPLSPTTQFGGASAVDAIRQDGVQAGRLSSFAIGDDGTITGTFSNGRSQVLGKLAVSTFANPSGLVKAGSTHLRASAASGDPIVAGPGEGGAGTLAAGALEMSNVDLGQEFTNLIIAQRGFEANSKIITSSDELLQTLVNLKR